VGIDEVTPHRRGVILDRDGTLIDVVRDEETGVISTAFHPSQVKLLAGVVEGLKLLADDGYALAIATNQPAPAKGQYSRAAVEATNAAVVEALAAAGLRVEMIAVCMHHPEGGPGGDLSLVKACECRKPKPGLLLDVARALDLDAAESWMIGDTTSDVEAGRAASMKTALIFDRRRCELCPLRTGPNVTPDVVGANLVEVARAIKQA
jgi:D-glycero-D-manno-heptose 1,7-bisphosphate phosphatase